MDDFNPKKSRANKLRQDKYRDRPKKHVDSGGKGDSKDVNQGKSVKVVKNDNQEKTNKAQNDCENKSSGEENTENSTESFSKRKLVSNWNRYEEPVNMSKFEDDVDDNIAKFEDLLAMPVSDGHLKLKHEHEWEKEKSELQMPWFQLNIQAVEKNLSTIPFHIRQNIAQSIFSESHIQRIAARAKRNAASIQEINEGILKIQSLSMHNNPKEDVDAIVNTVRHEPILDNRSEPKGKQSSTPVYQQVEDEVLDSILALHDNPSKLTRSESKEEPKKTINEDSTICDTLTRVPHPQQSPGLPQAATSADPPHSLDDWLDSILDD